jgi:hypothetical protein
LVSMILPSREYELYEVICNEAMEAFGDRVHSIETKMLTEDGRQTIFRKYMDEHKQDLIRIRVRENKIYVVRKKEYMNTQVYLHLDGYCLDDGRISCQFERMEFRALLCDMRCVIKGFFA